MRTTNSTDKNLIDTDTWLNSLLAQHAHKNPQLIHDAYNLARLYGEKQAAFIGESCLQQGLAMAEILNSLQLDDESLAAGMIYSSVRHTDLSEQDVEEHLGANIKKLVQWTKQMDGISELYAAAERHEYYHPKIDIIRKMLLAMVNDVRAVLIKLVERLFVLRGIKIFPVDTQQKIARETMAIYAPLANRLGIGQIKWELEDLSFRCLETATYQKIAKFLNERRIDREAYVKNFIDNLKTTLQTAGIKDMQISGRVKHIYSIYKKTQRKATNLSEIYDITAVRVLLPTVEDCYTVLSHVHSKWRHIAKEFDDYIAKPKPNGYKSIHTVIIGPSNKNVEIQIRTYQMHEEAELGVAAHWVYKEGKPAADSGYEGKIAWLRQVMDWQKEVTKTEDPLAEINRIFKDRVYVFTPDGDIIDLPQGATPLDFAYHIHSEVGHRCRGAKVNDFIVTLTYPLKTGERIEIITTKQPRPSRDWINPHLGFLKTSRAKAKVRQWFKKQDYEQHVADGQDALEREFRRLGLKNININDLAGKLNYKTSDVLLAAIGRGEIKLSSITNLVQRETTPAPKEEFQVTLPKTAEIRKKPTDVEIHGVGNLLTRIANCCRPIPGEAIIGYITRGQGVSIHRQNCGNILRVHKTNPEKLIEVSWGEKHIGKYPINLIIEAFDRPGLVKDITDVLAGERVFMTGLNCGTNKKDRTAYINLTIEIDSLELLNSISTKISQLPNVSNVRRI